MYYYITADPRASAHTLETFPMADEQTTNHTENLPTTADPQVSACNPGT